MRIEIDTEIVRSWLAALPLDAWWMPTRARCAALCATIAVSSGLHTLVDASRPETPAPPVMIAPPTPPPPSIAVIQPAPPAVPPEPPDRLLFLPSEECIKSAWCADGVLGRRRASFDLELELVTAGDTVYMLDGNGQLLWRYSLEGLPLTDTPIVDSNGTIVVIAFDLVWRGLDAVTGEVRWRRSANGRAVYSQIETYGRDRYFVVTDMSGYRENLGDLDFADSLQLCEGPTTVWSTYLPAGAEIRVDGDRVFAISTDERGVERIREIRVPARFRP